MDPLKASVSAHCACLPLPRPAAQHWQGRGPANTSTMRRPGSHHSAACSSSAVGPRSAMRIDTHCGGRVRACARGLPSRAVSSGPRAGDGAAAARAGQCQGQSARPAGAVPHASLALRLRAVVLGQPADQGDVLRPAARPRSCQLKWRTLAHWPRRGVTGCSGSSDYRELHCWERGPGRSQEQGRERAHHLMMVIRFPCIAMLLRTRGRSASGREVLCPHTAARRPSRQCSMPPSAVASCAAACDVRMPPWAGCARAARAQCSCRTHSVVAAQAKRCRAQQVQESRGVR